MITTRRSENSEASVFEQRSATVSVGLLERQMPENTSRYSMQTTSEENLEEAKLRMQRNLDKLLNYDKQVEEEELKETSAVYDTITDTVMETAIEEKFGYQNVQVVNDVQEDDIRPTSTTMQFGDGEIDHVYNDMNKSKEESKNSYRLNTKGKIVVALYALAVFVILALIVINTGLIASLKNNNTVLAEQVNAMDANYANLQEEIEYTSSNEYVENWAKDNGLIK